MSVFSCNSTDNNRAESFCLQYIIQLPPVWSNKTGRLSTGNCCKQIYQQLVTVSELLLQLVAQVGRVSSPSRVDTLFGALHVRLGLTPKYQLRRCPPFFLKGNHDINCLGVFRRKRANFGQHELNILFREL
jgi:hypothetical protein